MLADRATLRYHRHPCAGFLLLGRVSSILQGILRVSITALSHLLSSLYAGLNDGEEPNRPDKPAEFDNSRDRVSTEIAHLTYDRLLVTPEHKNWDPSLGNKILEIMDSFFSV